MSHASIETAFEPLLSKPAWQVSKGGGSFITMEFGDPELHVREPIESKSDSKKVRDHLARRQVHIRGQWHLWIYCCAWQITEHAELLAHNESSDAEISQAATRLDSQLLTGVTLRSDCSTRLSFDLGGELTTRPYDDDSEQWLLYEPDGMVLSVRADGMFSHSSGDVTPEEEVWLPLWV